MVKDEKAPGGPPLERAVLAELVERLATPLLVFDQDSTLLYANPAARELLGQDLDGLQAADFFTSLVELSELVREVLGAGRSGVRRRVRLRDLAGRSLSVEIHAVRLEGGEWACVFQDRGEREQLERRLEETTRRYVELQRRSESRTGNRIAHEFNQPLTVAMGTLELLVATTPLEEGVKQRLDRVYEQLQRIARLVRSLSQQSARPVP